jgi:hypothetical protein
MDGKQLQAVRTFADYFILTLEVEEIKGKKIEAVNAQQFETASRLRDKEVEMRSKIPSLQQLKEARALL